MTSRSCGRPSLAVEAGSRGAFSQAGGGVCSSREIDSILDSAAQLQHLPRPILTVVLEQVSLDRLTTLRNSIPANQRSGTWSASLNDAIALVVVGSLNSRLSTIGIATTTLGMTVGLSLAYLFKSDFFLRENLDTSLAVTCAIQFAGAAFDRYRDWRVGRGPLSHIRDSLVYSQINRVPLSIETRQSLEKNPFTSRVLREFSK